MAAKRSSVVRALEGVGVTMLSSRTPLAVGAGDKSDALESNTSPEKGTFKLFKHTLKESKHVYYRFYVTTHMRTLLALTALPIKYEVVQREVPTVSHHSASRFPLPSFLLLLLSTSSLMSVLQLPELLEAVSLYTLPILPFIPLPDLIPSPPIQFSPSPPPSTHENHLPWDTCPLPYLREMERERLTVDDIKNKEGTEAKIDVWK